MNRGAYKNRARLILSALFLTAALSVTFERVFAQTPTFARTDYAGIGNNHVAGDFNGDGTTAAVQSSISIPAGATSASFTITTRSVNASTAVTITSTYQ